MEDLKIKENQQLQETLKKARRELEELTMNQAEFDKLSDNRISEFEIKVNELNQNHQVSAQENLQKSITQLKLKLQDAESSLSNQTIQNQKLIQENQDLKKSICQFQTNAEAEEEYISNMLLKKIQTLQDEKQELLLKVEAEEEMITNKLQKKLSKLQNEKIQMEVALEQEQECMVNRLQKQLDDLRSITRSRLPSSNSEKNLTSPLLSPAASGKWGSLTQIEMPPSVSVVEMLRAENNSLIKRLQESKTTTDTWCENAVANMQHLITIIKQLDVDKKFVVDIQKIESSMKPPVLASYTNNESVFNSPVAKTPTTPSKRLSSRVPHP